MCARCTQVEERNFVQVFYLSAGEIRTSEKVSMIQQRLKTTFDRQNSYTNPKKDDVSFSAEDLIFLEVSHMKGSDEV